MVSAAMLAAAAAASEQHHHQQPTPFMTVQAALAAGGGGAAGAGAGSGLLGGGPPSLLVFPDLSAAVATQRSTRAPPDGVVLLPSIMSDRSEHFHDPDSPLGYQAAADAAQQQQRGAKVAAVRVPSLAGGLAGCDQLPQQHAPPPPLLQCSTPKQHQTAAKQQQGAAKQQQQSCGTPRRSASLLHKLLSSALRGGVGRRRSSASGGGGQQQQQQQPQQSVQFPALRQRFSMELPSRVAKASCQGGLLSRRSMPLPSWQRRQEDAALAAAALAAAAAAATAASRGATPNGSLAAPLSAPASPAPSFTAAAGGKAGGAAPAAGGLAMCASVCDPALQQQQSQQQQRLSGSSGVGRRLSSPTGSLRIPTIRTSSTGGAAAGGALPGTPSSRLAAALPTACSLRSSLMRLEAGICSRVVDCISDGLMRLTSYPASEGLLRGPVGQNLHADWEPTGYEYGSGASGVTRLVIHKRDALPAACKTIYKAGIFCSAEARAALLCVQREIAIMQHTQGHPHIVQLRAVYEDARSLHLVMEVCQGGSLTALLQRCPGGRLCEPAAAAAMRAVLEVLAHCHGRGLMHRDIKPDNLLVTQQLDDPQQLAACHVKVADFGISLPLVAGQQHSEVRGTPLYMAPELLQGRYGAAADVWAAGVTLYEVLSGRMPFAPGPEVQTGEQLLAFVLATDPLLAGPGWDDVSAEAKSLVGMMLLKDPVERPSAQQLLDAFASWLALGSRP